MITYLLGLYLKLNLLLVAAFLLWVATRKAAGFYRFGLSHAEQLAVARFLFLAFMAAVPAAWLLDLVLPGLLGDVLARAPGSALAGEMAVAANIDEGLNRRLGLAGLEFLLGYGLLALIGGGLLVQGSRLCRQWLQLRRIVAGGVHWRRMHGIHILFSASVGTPFSTRALGRRHIVLPIRLLESPVNLRLALRHELQHLRNGDLGWVLFIEAVKLLCFWNPAAHAWHNEFDCLQEFACDEVLVRRRRVDAREYGHCLLDVAANAVQPAFLASSNMAPRFSLLRPAASQLKRRILMLNHTRSDRFKSFKVLLYVTLFGTGLAHFSLLVFAQADADRPAVGDEVPVQPDRQAPRLVVREGEQEYVPVFTRQPEYPARAWERGVEGWAQVMFTVNTEGEVEEAVVVDAEPPGVFDESSLAAVRDFRFNPRIIGGEAVSTPEVHYIFKYEIAEE